MAELIQIRTKAFDHLPANARNVLLKMYRPSCSAPSVSHGRAFDLYPCRTSLAVKFSSRKQMKKYFRSKLDAFSHRLRVEGQILECRTYIRQISFRNEWLPSDNTKRYTNHVRRASRTTF
ncbi:hypothetical protein KP509_30G005900 [Ceratopteris richardii]|uniref:Uncharacterized protein n=1 Tax=Ceratopteris richardii TaxID=49495 RepID=A0A8T2QZR9_CERRI|nr:hypothetical protein KP509_30G005900 [Ceratopteris richardii]